MEKIPHFCCNYGKFYPICVEVMENFATTMTIPMASCSARLEIYS